MSRANTCIKDEKGNEQWISRSCVVLPVVFKMDENGDIYTILEKRGKAVSHCGEWCCPCGYIDWDETLEEACYREVYEETSLLLDMENIKFFDVTSNKYSKSQSVNLWYECWVDKDVDIDFSKIVTKDEVEDLKWLKVAKIEKTGFINKTFKLKIYKKNIIEGCGKWAFRTHKAFISKMLQYHFRNYGLEIVE